MQLAQGIYHVAPGEDFDKRPSINSKTRQHPTRVTADRVLMKAVQLLHTGLSVKLLDSALGYGRIRRHIY